MGYSFKGLALCQEPGFTDLFYVEVGEKDYLLGRFGGGGGFLAVGGVDYGV